MDLTQAQFETISQGLRVIASRIPLEWGHIQNNAYDNELAKVCNIFEVLSLSEFEKKITSFNADHQQYYLKRWFAVRCANCDEYLFYKNDGVTHNPNQFDKKLEIDIKDRVKFDVKSTVIPHCFRYYSYCVLMNPMEIVEFYYDHQSKGRRYDMQNRLFIVHHSLVDPAREPKLRCGWGSKEYVFAKFVREINNISFMIYREQTAGVIFLVETEPKVLKYKIAGLDSEFQSIPQ